MAELAMLMYTNEPCRICGKFIPPTEVRDLVFAGYSKDNMSRVAHGVCWREGKPKAEWAYPVDET